jgi:hypothetical protein
MEVSPSATNQFKKTETAALYAEVYEPLLKGPTPPKVAFEIKVVERKTGQEKFSQRQRIELGNTGDPVIPLGLQLPLVKLDPGLYRVELRAEDSAGNATKTRTADFDVE